MHGGNMSVQGRFLAENLSAVPISSASKLLLLLVAFHVLSQFLRSRVTFLAPVVSADVIFDTVVGALFVATQVFLSWEGLVTLVACEWALSRMASLVLGESTWAIE
jgi:hypothetical protein